MNVNPIIISALAGLTFNGEVVSVTPIVNTSSEKPNTYITYYTLLDKDEAYSDDEAMLSGTYVTVDIFCKGNYKALVENVKLLLKSAGFTIQSIGPEQYEKDTGLYHVPIDLYMEGFYG